MAAALQVGAGDVVQHEQGRLNPAAADVPAVQVLLDPFSAGGPFVQGTVPVVFGERVQSEDFADGLVSGPADGRQAGALVQPAAQDQKQGRLAAAAGAQGATQAEPVGDCFDGVEGAEGGPADGPAPGEVVELTAQGAAERFAALGGPVGEAGQSTVADLLALTAAFAQQVGGLGAAVGDLGDEHAHMRSRQESSAQANQSSIHDYGFPPKNPISSYPSTL